MASFHFHPSSYRDPSGFLFFHEGRLYRQVNKSFGPAFDAFHHNGLSQHLVGKGLLTPYSIFNRNLTGSEDWHQTLLPEVLPFISYPYEWCFDMLKEAALNTLQIAQEAMSYNMLLKDASAYNLQLHKGQMQFIDTLSFEPYDEHQPWIAYRQFCEHFFAPLALMHYQNEPLQPLLLTFPDGIPLQVAKKLLPARSKWNLHVYLHLHLGARLSAKAKDRNEKPGKFSRTKLLQLLKSFEGSIQSFSLDEPSGVWSAYYDEAAQRNNYIEQKKELVAAWLNRLNAKTAIDVGANEGEFSMLLAQEGIYTISADFDHYSINNLYKRVKKEKIENLHPLIVDMANPTPAIGVNNEERASLLQRVNVALVLALAVIHHLAIGRNIDFAKIATLFSSMGRQLIIEFVPKTDEKIRLMLQHKKDVYQWYTKEAFLAAFTSHYRALAEAEIGSSGRILYLFERL